MRRQITDIHELLNANRSSPSFIRVIHYSGEFEQTLIQLYEKARQNGVIIEGRIPNPTDSNLLLLYVWKIRSMMILFSMLNNSL